MKIMSNKTSGLEKLYITNEINEEDLSKILEPYLRIDPQNKQIYLLPDFFRLKSKYGVIIVLLGVKALTLKNMRESEMIGPTEIADISKINLSTVKNCLRELEKEKIAISKKGKYTIPNFLLTFLKEKFENLKEIKTEKKSLKIKTGRKRKIRGPTIDTSKIDQIFKLPPEKFAEGFYNFLIKKPGKYLEKALIVLKLAKDNCEIDGLTAGEITKILQDHLRVPKIHHPNITTALGSKTASKYVFKQSTKSKKVYLYKLTKLGEDFVNVLSNRQKNHE